MTDRLPFKIGNRPLQGNFDALATRLAVLEKRPRFRVYRQAAHSLATGNVVVFDTEEVDTHGWFDPTTGKFTPLIAGEYRFSWGVRPNAVLAADVWWRASLRKAGAIVKLGQVGYQRAALTAVNSLGTAKADANGTTDAFDIVIEHSVGAAQALNVALNGRDVFLDGELVG